MKVEIADLNLINEVLAKRLKKWHRKIHFYLG